MMRSRLRKETYNQKWRLTPRFGFTHSTKDGHLVLRDEVSWKNINGILFKNPFLNRVTYLYWYRGPK